MKKTILLFLLAAAEFVLHAAAPDSAIFAALPPQSEEKDQKLYLSCLHRPGKLTPKAEIPPEYLLEIAYEQLQRGSKDNHFNIWIAGRRYIFRDHQISRYDGTQEFLLAKLNLYAGNRAVIKAERSGNRTILSINGRQAVVDEYPAGAPALDILVMNLDIALEQFDITVGGKPLPLKPEISRGAIFHADALRDPRKWRQSPAAVFDSGRLLVTAGNRGAEAGNSDKAVGVRDVLGKMEEAKQKVFVTERGIDLSDLRGCEVELSVEVRAEVARPAVPWEGVRIVLNYATESSVLSDCYYDLWGSFDWKTVTFKTRVPTLLKEASLTLGVIADAGFAEFRNLRLTVTEPPRTPGMAPVSVEKYTGRAAPLRGFNASANIIRDNQLAFFAKQWNANIYKISWHPPLPEPAEEFEAALEKQFSVWDEFIRQAAESNVQVILELYPSKWRFAEDLRGKSDIVYYRPGYAEKLRDIWARIAERYKGNRTVYAFELWNESQLRTQVTPGCPDYVELTGMIARAINQTDPERTIIVQPEEWWGVYAFGKLRPVNAKNIVYSLHYYAPFALTHQNLSGKQPNTAGYPGMITNIYWDKEMMRKELQPVIEFCRAYNVHVHVTEFSCIRWAPGADRWINDAIELFEEFGWDWSFHAVSEWPGWNPGYGANPGNTWKIVPNPSLDVLLKYLKRNGKAE